MSFKHALAFLIGILLVLGGDCIICRMPTAQDPLSTASQLPPPSSTPSPTPSAMPTASLTATTMPSPLATPTAPTGPDTIALPVGFLPSDMTNGQGSEFFVGSRGSAGEGGQIYRGDFLTGEVDLFIELAAGEMAAGLQFDPRTNYLFVSGADDVRVYDATNGALVHRYPVSQEEGLVSDLVVTAAGVYAADLFHPVLYHIPLAPNGALMAEARSEMITIRGDYAVSESGSNQPFQSIGLTATADGQWLLITNNGARNIARIEPTTGKARSIDGTIMMFGDGLVLDGDLLYVVQKTDLLTVIQLAPDLANGKVILLLNTANYPFNFPTAAVRFGDALYVANGLPGRSRMLGAGSQGPDYVIILRVPRWQP